jgi:putative chitinase
MYFSCDITKVAMFLANTDYESTGFTKLEENLNYSNAQRILSIFGRNRICGLEEAQQLVNNPVALGNAVYGGRFGNAEDEGYKYRGRGYIQLTFKDNYATFSQFAGVDFVTQPNLVATPEYAMLAAVFYWVNKNINNVDPFTAENARRKVNAGLIGLNEVSALYDAYFGILKE